MPIRVGGEIFAVILITAVLVLGGFGLLELSDGTAPAEAFLSTAPRAAVGFAGIGFAVAALAIAGGGVLARNRTRRVRLLVSLLAGLAGAIVNVVVGAVVGLTAGGWSALLLAFAVVGAGVLLGAVVAAVLLTYLVFFRQTV
ncbi:MAG: hypothetical protein JWP85_1110 [Rhodoglobus sp.]|nr:hypothetical protein [Rhodoglobus sp.]